MPDEITYPTIHLNGNCKDRLQGQYQEVLDNLRDAIGAIDDIEFHARDYYVQGDDAFPKAQQEFIAHLVKPMQEAEEYLDKVVNNISQQ